MRIASALLLTLDLCLGRPQPCVCRLELLTDFVELLMARC